MAYGVIGLRPWELLDFTPREYLNAYRGANMHSDRQQQTQYEVARHTAYLIITTITSEVKKPHDLGRFPWEGK